MTSAERDPARGTQGRSRSLFVAVVGVVLVILAADWLGSGRPDSPSSAPASTGEGQPEGAEPWATRASEVYESWAGTLDEHRAAEVVIAHKLNGAFSSCMADRGYPRPWTESVWPAPVPKDSLLYSFWAAGRLDGYYSQKVINAEVGQRIESAANAHEARGEEAAAERDCRAERPGAGDDAVGEIRDPAVVRELTKGWSTALAPVLASGGDPASYDECMASNGILATLGVESTDEARRALSSPMPPGSVPLGNEPSTPEWDAYLADERAFVDADWTCREDVRRGLGDRVEQSVESFETEYADQIHAARQHWESVHRQAEALGWSPGDQLPGNPG